MLKYIMLTERDGREVAFFCLAPTKHLELALSQQDYQPGRTIVSAGFVEWINGEARTYGFSDSLNLGPRESDAAFLTVFARATADCCAASISAR